MTGLFKIGPGKHLCCVNQVRYSSVTELEEVVRIMAAGQLGRAGRYLLWSDKDSTMREHNQPKLTDQEVKDIVAFLNALSSDRLLAKRKK